MGRHIQHSPCLTVQNKTERLQKLDEVYGSLISHPDLCTVCNDNTTTTMSENGGGGNYITCSHCQTGSVPFQNPDLDTIYLCDNCNTEIPFEIMESGTIASV